MPSAQYQHQCVEVIFRLSPVLLIAKLIPLTLNIIAFRTAGCGASSKLKKFSASKANLLSFCQGKIVWAAAVLDWNYVFVCDLFTREKEIEAERLRLIHFHRKFVGSLMRTDGWFKAFTPLVFLNSPKQLKHFNWCFFLRFNSTYRSTT